MECEDPSTNCPDGEGQAVSAPGTARAGGWSGSLLSRKLYVRLFLVLIVVAITSSIFVYRDRVEELETLGYLGAFLIALIAAATVILPVPGIVLIAALGATHNAFLIGLAAGAGAALGEITGYLAGYSGQVVVENSRMYARLEEWMRRRGTIVIFVLSLVPNPFFDIAGGIAGILRFPLWRFLAVCFCGKALMNIGVAYLGGWGFTWITEHF